MGRSERVFEKILLGNSDANIDFNDLRSVLDELGFGERIKGSHHIFSHVKVVEIINIQPKGNKAKPYQVRQVRNIILNYRLRIVDE
jgi:predicted RNA binding protein YcfA (HicA-like mRNA interferase family)